MKTLSNIKKDMEFNRGLSSLIEALKNIAVAQFRILEQRLRSFERLLQTLEGFSDFVDLTKIDHPFLNPRNKSLAVVAITSDSGLLGGLNMQVISKAFSELEGNAGRLIVIGERGKVYACETSVPFVAFPGIKDEERYEQAMQMRDYIIKGVLEGAFGRLKVIYPRPISFTFQRVETVSFLPFVPALRQRPAAAESASEIIFESRIGDIVEYLVYIWIGQKFYEMFGLSRLAEFAARFVHLEGSHQKLKEMDRKVNLEYFRVRHELIDRNMRELFATRLLYAS